MSFREKTAWISLLASLAIYGSYFAALARATGQGEVDRGYFFGLLVGSTVLFILAMIVLSIAAALLAPKDAMAREDERERLISLKAVQFAYFVLSTGAVAAIGAAFLGVAGFMIANGLFLTLVVAEFAKETVRIVQFRRGA